MKKHLLLIVVLACLLIGCGNTEKLDTYYDGMQSFNGNVQIITETLDLIDVTRDSAADQITTQLNKLLEQFRIMSELEVPRQFAACEELGDDAYTYMQEAVRLYKEWLANPDNTSDDTLEMAKENYERAMTRVNYISIILQGGVPEGEGITITEEDATDFSPVVDDSSANDAVENDVLPETEPIVDDEELPDDSNPDEVDEFAY
ncbi:MAG: hypothetical protein K6G69_08440 [Lachnospiraceae bacterium]|nr:hypothetical protein [Lachnospiraceae bacterium]